MLPQESWTCTAQCRSPLSGSDASHALPKAPRIMDSEPKSTKEMAFQATSHELQATVAVQAAPRGVPTLELACRQL